MNRLASIAKAGALLVLAAISAAAEDTIELWDGAVGIGGQIRSRAEAFGNYYTPDGASDRDDELWLLRTRLHLDVHPDDSWRVYIEGQDSREFVSDLVNRRAVPNGFVDDLDLYQAFFEMTEIGGSPFSLKVGRQTLVYGKQRLVGAFDWNNTSRSFDAAKATIGLPEWFDGSIDVFAGKVANHDYHNFNDILNDDSPLYGAYSTWREVPFADFLDAYYLLRDRDADATPETDGDIHTLGARAGRRYDSRWDWEIELAGQTGDWGTQDHTAFASHIELGYTFDHEWSPRAALAHSFATGDGDPNDGDHETFENLFPTNHLHYGQADLFSWRNMHNIELGAAAAPMEGLKTAAALHVFFLAEADTDAWYNAGGGRLRLAAPGSGPGSYVGSELDLKAAYQFNSNFSIEGGYAHFFAGDYAGDTGEDDGADWGYLQATFTF